MDLKDNIYDCMTISVLWDNTIYPLEKYVGQEEKV